MNLDRYFDDFIIVFYGMTEDDGLHLQDYDLFHGPLITLDFLQEDLEEFYCDSQ